VTVDISTLYLTGKSKLVDCSARNAGGVAVKDSLLLIRDFANLTECRARENGGGIMTFGRCQISVTGKVAYVCIHRHMCVHRLA
jgi:hypothetical protein